MIHRVGCAWKKQFAAEVAAQRDVLLTKRTDAG